MVERLTHRCGEAPARSAVQVRPGGTFRLRGLSPEARTCAFLASRLGPLLSVGRGDSLGLWRSGSAPERQVASLLLRRGAVKPSPRWPNLLGVP